MISKHLRDSGIPAMVSSKSVSFSIKGNHLNQGLQKGKRNHMYLLASFQSYHSGMLTKDRSRVQTLFCSNKIRVVTHHHAFFFRGLWFVLVTYI